MSSGGAILHSTPLPFALRQRVEKPHPLSLDISARLSKPFAVRLLISQPLAKGKQNVYSTDFSRNGDELCQKDKR